METTHSVTLLYQQLRQIGSILSSDTSNESNFTHDGLMLVVDGCDYAGLNGSVTFRKIFGNDL
jgi:hypothetical protein